MAASKKKQSLPSGVSVEALIDRELQHFYHGQPGDPVTSARFYWAKGSGPRESIEEHFRKKRRPAGAESPVDTAARVEALLRADVPEDYADPDFLTASYMSKLPAEETAAFAQVTLSFPSATNLHGPWRQATSWLRDQYVDRLGIPVLAVLHAPFLAGSDSPVHLHALILMRKLTAFGWLSTHRELAGDAGLKAAEASWKDLVAG